MTTVGDKWSCAEPLFDHPVCAQQLGLRYFDAACFCGLELDWQIELGLLLDRLAPSRWRRSPAINC